MSINIKNHATVMMLKEVAETADGFEKRTSSLGETAADCFGEKHKSQIRNIENLAYSTNKVTDIKDFIKKQTGKHKEWSKNNFGKDLLEEITNLTTGAKKIKEKINLKFVSAEEKDLPSIREIHILLIRDFIKQVSAHYFFELSGGVN